MRVQCFEVPRFLLAALLSIGLSVPAVAGPQADAPTGGDDQVAEVEDADESATETDQSESVATEAVGQPEWIQAVDGWFGKYLVAPIGAVLFYDFGTSVPFVVLWLLAGGVFLTLRMGFINIRAFRHAINLTRGLYDNPQ